MPKTILLVDYENVGKIDLSAIPAEVHVPFFFGASQKSVPTDFMRSALKLGNRFLPIDIEGHGTNALDFHIAFYLGEYLAADAQTRCIILSKDKGFDPLLKHLAGRNFSVRRASSMTEAFAPPQTKPTTTPKAAPAKKLPEDPYASAVAWLKAMQPRTRPRKRKGLIAHLHAHWKEIPEADLARIVDRMIAEKKLSETNGGLTYQL